LLAYLTRWRWPALPDLAAALRAHCRRFVVQSAARLALIADGWRWPYLTGWRSLACAGWLAIRKAPKMRRLKCGFDGWPLNS
jgi:hypothetical protein